MTGQSRRVLSKAPASMPIAPSRGKPAATLPHKPGMPPPAPLPPRESNAKMIRNLMEANGLMYSDVARICRVSLHTVKSWMKPVTTKSSSSPPDMAVELFYLKMGLPAPLDSKGPSMNDYDTDISRWSERQGAMLRRRANGELINEAEFDWPNIAEEIESLGKTVARELASHIAVVLEHLIKLQASPANDPRNGWKGSVRRARVAIQRDLKDAPSLRRTVAAVIAEETPPARMLAAASLEEYGEQPRIDIASLTFTENEVLGDWWPA
jgi:hypothetical protein